MKAQRRFVFNLGSPQMRFVPIGVWSQRVLKIDGSLSHIRSCCEEISVVGNECNRNHLIFPLTQEWDANAQRRSVFCLYSRWSACLFMCTWAMSSWRRADAFQCQTSVRVYLYSVVINKAHQQTVRSTSEPPPGRRLAVHVGTHERSQIHLVEWTKNNTKHKEMKTCSITRSIQRQTGERKCLVQLCVSVWDSRILRLISGPHVATK